MSEALHCRWAEEADFEAVQRLSVQLARHIDEGEPVLAAESFRAAYVGPAAPMKLLLAELNGEVVGLASWTLVHELFSGGAALFLSDLVVDETARGQGVGRALMDGVKAWARAAGVRKLGWDVWRGNASAIAFYEEMGAKADHEAAPYRLTLEDPA
jgi:GNAT superfamily N-acetyltransferase